MYSMKSGNVAGSNEESHSVSSALSTCDPERRSYHMSATVEWDLKIRPVTQMGGHTYAWY